MRGFRTGHRTASAQLGRLLARVGGSSGRRHQVARAMPADFPGHANVKTTKKGCVKPGVEDLRGAATTWDGLNGVATQGQA
jgi:hypothetical protein